MGAGGVMSEPRYLEGDDIALGLDECCDDDCGCSTNPQYDTLEEMHDDF